VVQNAARLLTDGVDASVLPLHYLTASECRFLNELCATAGLVFTFDALTAMIDMSLLLAVHISGQVFIKDLSQKDPFGSAQYIEESSPQNDEQSAITTLFDAVATDQPSSLTCAARTALIAVQQNTVSVGTWFMLCVCVCVCVCALNRCR
jgi:hypothetical protein